jgi:hypothetical protein
VDFMMPERCRTSEDIMIAIKGTSQNQRPGMADHHVGVHPRVVPKWHEKTVLTLELNWIGYVGCMYVQ